MASEREIPDSGRRRRLHFDDRGNAVRRASADVRRFCLFDAALLPLLVHRAVGLI
jgi:hypothetical protein